ncbi:uncharacterized protein SAMN05892883_2391 [Jatrophihabitans sp. GAS493]|uniref:DUF58 domain-containing protein n=1 Tax=Jatrophihabitans sp. GAS493 TaxID=1907575 RepID=UPI000BB851AB|nr:DUF58 domain-containing protein [Jatrophihabitans sp. GAS493]SOD73095.1 uncharacterized protein SAMN05892883_2391 [Jatrophihabitans sp. GAS493]
MAITGRLVAVFGCCLLLVVLPAAIVWTVFGLLLLAVIVDLLAAARIADLRFSRDPSAAVRLGGDGETTLRVLNVGRRTLRGVINDGWTPSSGAQPYATPVRIAAGDRVAVRTRLRPTRRGERRSVTVSVRARGPLGLAARQRRLPVPGTLKVLPAFASRKFLPEKLSRLRQIDGAVLVRQRGQGSEFDSLREYVAGDDVRSIDWRATARHRDTVVRTWRPERDRNIVLALDTGRSSAARIGDEPRLDAALDAALLLGALAARAGDRVAMIAADTKVQARLPLSSRADTLAQLVGALTPLEATLVETDPQLLAAEIRRTSSKRALVVLFTSLDETAADGLLAAAAALTQRHLLVVASVIDPHLIELTGARATPDETYTAAAAELALQARSEVAARLTRLGAVVVQAPADTFASKVADSYLDLKAAGRL